MKRLFFIISLFVYLNSFAQGFVSVGITNQIANARAYSDSNYFYACGWILDSINTFQRVSILRYNGTQWDTLSGFNGQVLDVKTYHDTLYACGVFTAVNSDTSIKYIAKYNGTTWESMGNFNQYVDRIKVVNDSLFALGGFSIIDGDTISSVAKWNGSKWINFYGFPYIPPANGFSSLRDITYYKNNYYVVGNFFGTTLNFEDIAVYKNGNWQKVGQGLVGGNTTVNVLAVYKNELYFSGMIDESAGNMGHTILKWNDTTLSKVGDGLQNANNQNSGFPQSWDLTVHNDYLYASGTFSFANHIPAQGLARWDGIQWCGFATDTISNQLNGSSLVFFQDTMYWTTNIDTINGIFVNKFLKYTGDTATATCNTWVGINESVGLESKISIYPNPNAGSFTMATNNYKNTTIEIYNNIGQLIFNNSLTQSNTLVNLTNYPKGMYFIRIKTPTTTKTEKIVYQ